MFGFLNIYKPAGMTSHDVVGYVRRITGIKHIGHTGTLDPFAEGVLPVCIGKAARLIEYLNDEKAYIGGVQLGSSTETYDIEGAVVNRSDKKVSFKDIEACLEYFRGDIEQIPPIYSAIKVGGKKLYEYAREGKSINVKPRNVHIDKLEILDFDEKKQRLRLEIECSKGTYIRSIANDIGEKLGVYAHLFSLIRIKAGDFEVENAIKLNDLDNIEKVQLYLINPLDKLHFPIYELSEEEKIKVSNGMPINNKESFSDLSFVALTCENRLVAVAQVDKSVLKCVKVFI